MDAKRFDALAKALISETNRRRTLGGLLGGALGALGLADPDEAWSAKSGKCKQACGACERCKKGKCKRKNGKKRCKPGKCKLQEGLVDCPAGQVRNPLTCGCCKPNGPAACGLDNCCSGLCALGNCLGRNLGQSCEFGAQCGSGFCGPAGTCANPA